MLQQIQQQLIQISEQNTTIAFKVRDLNKTIKKSTRIITGNMIRYFNQPAPPIRGALAAAPAVPEQAVEEAEVEWVGGQDFRPPQVLFSNAPRTLYDLWIEWTTGLGGNKAAKDFTSHERGQVRFKYCRRKVFWDCVSQHIRAGYTALTAIDRIHAAYGNNLSVSSILALMARDKKNNGQENLRL